MTDRKRRESKTRRQPKWGLIEKLAPRFNSILPALISSLHHITERSFPVKTPADRLVFVFAHIAVENFMEILILCRQGYGLGGLQILRSLYERAVTLAYVSKSPTEAEVFLNYHAINKAKVLNQAKELDQMDLYGLSREQIEEIAKEHETTKPLFTQTLCKKCGTTRQQISWSKLDLFTMAKKADKHLRESYTSLYILPTFHSHATVPSVLSRLHLSKDGKVRYKAEAQPQHVPTTLIGAHNLILKVCDLANDHFALGLNDELHERMKDFIVAWPNKGKE